MLFKYLERNRCMYVDFCEYITCTSRKRFKRLFM